MPDAPNVIQFITVSPYAGSVPASLGEFYYGTWVGLGTGGSTAPGLGQATDLPLVTTNIPASDPKWYVAFTVAQNFSAYLVGLDDTFDAVSDNLQIQVHGTVVSGSELRDLWDIIDSWEVNGTGYAPGIGGQNHGNSIEINWQTLAGYQANGGVSGSDGWNYLVMHEMAHNSTLGLAARDYYWGKNLANGNLPYQKGNPYFEQHEATINSIARDLADGLGIDIIPLPQYGFDW